MDPVRCQGVGVSKEKATLTSACRAEFAIPEPLPTECADPEPDRERLRPANSEWIWDVAVPCAVPHASATPADADWVLLNRLMSNARSKGGLSSECVKHEPPVWVSTNVPLEY